MVICNICNKMFLHASSEYLFWKTRMKTRPVRLSEKLHQRLKSEAAKRGMKLQAFAEHVVLTALKEIKFKHPI